MVTGYFSSLKRTKKRYDNRTPEQKERNKELKNKYNQRPEIKEKNNQRMKELKEISKEIGNCIQCYNQNPELKYAICPKCRKRNREKANIKYHEKNKTAVYYKK